MGANPAACDTHNQKAADRSGSRRSKATSSDQALLLRGKAFASDPLLIHGRDLAVGGGLVK